jgi:hypothetical protein
MRDRQIFPKFSASYSFKMMAFCFPLLAGFISTASGFKIMITAIYILSLLQVRPWLFLISDG